MLSVLGIDSILCLRSTSPCIGLLYRLGYYNAFIIVSLIIIVTP